MSNHHNYKQLYQSYQAPAGLPNNPQEWKNPTSRQFHQQRRFNSNNNGNDNPNGNYKYSRWDSGYQGPKTNFTEPQRLKRRKVDEDVSISKKLAYILRHGAFNMGLKMNKQGFVYVNDILKLRGYRQVCEDDIVRIVSNNNKQRFHLQRDRGGYLMIGANQGHSIKVEEINLQPITDAKSYPCVVHGTTYDAWGLINGVGLKTMGRTHIHFASGEPGEEGVISGMRNSSQVLIYIDLEKALGNGIKFSLSRNGVILSEGDTEKTISHVYFKAVIDRKTRQSLNNIISNNKEEKKIKHKKRKRSKRKRSKWEAHTNANTTAVTKTGCDSVHKQ